MSYSQRDEQDVILRHFHQVKLSYEEKDPTWIRKFRFLDIGAFDGKTFSNTLALAERGWGGLCIEPCAAAFKALLETHKSRPYIKLLNTAAGSAGTCKIIPFYYSPDALGTSDPKHYEKWKSAGQYQEIYLPEISLSSILEYFPGPYQFINIDTEGTSGVLFASLPLVQLQCELVCVEYSQGDQWLIEERGRVQGYRVIHTTAENLILASGFLRRDEL